MSIQLNPRFVIDKDKKPNAVLLTIDEWEKIIEALEELDDIRAYDKAKSDSQEAVPFDQAVREIQEDYES